MKNFHITLYEKLTHTIEVQAENEEEAVEQAFTQLAEDDSAFVTDSEGVFAWDVIDYGKV